MTSETGSGSPQALTIGMSAPQFEARTTMGHRALLDYRGRWLVFFSHPADFTPVCTSEFIAFARAFDRFQTLGCELLALSVDSLYAHVAWVRSIANEFGVEIPFPVVEDPSMAVAQAYGMIFPGAEDSSTVRATFVIDPKGVIRAISWYPMTTGRSVEEILRLVQALQTCDHRAVSTPEGWHPGDDVIDTPNLDLRFQSAADVKDRGWFFRRRNVGPSV